MQGTIGIISIIIGVGLIGYAIGEKTRYPTEEICQIQTFDGHMTDSSGGQRLDYKKGSSLCSKRIAKGRSVTYIKE